MPRNTKSKKAKNGGRAKQLAFANKRKNGHAETSHTKKKAKGKNRAKHKKKK